MTDLRHFENAEAGYYQACWVDDKGRVCGWIPKPVSKSVESVEKIPESWMIPPFFALLYDLKVVTVVGYFVLDLVVNKEAQEQLLTATA